MSVPAFVGYLKGKSSLLRDEQFADLTSRYRRHEFWCRGYDVDTAGENKAKIADDIRRQLTEGNFGGRLSLPYAGGLVTDAGNRNADVRPHMRLSGAVGKKCLTDAQEEPPAMPVGS